MNKFDIKQRLDNLVYTAYNAISEALFLFDKKSRELVAGNSVYKDLHRGDRCFIMGTGPSLSELTVSEVEKLKTEIMFGVNSYYRSDLARVLKPKYYGLVDDLYWKDWSETFSRVSDVFAENPPVFITDPRARHLLEGGSFFNKPIYVYAKKYPVNRMSSDISGNIYAPINVVGMCILVAMYMGFKEVYLLGCDYNAFCNLGRGHCYDDNEELEGFSYNLAFFLKYYWITTEFHYLIAKLAKKEGVKILNLTPSSLLDSYPRKSASDVL